VADTASSTITSFTIDQTTGALTLLETVPAGSGPTGLVLTPDGRYLVVANSDAPTSSWGGVGTVSVFARDPAAGTLVQIDGSPFPANTMALNIAMTPDARFVYTTNQDAFQVTTFSLDPATGALTQALFSPVAEREAHSIVMHPSGAYFYVGAEDSDIKGHAVNAADGSYVDTPGSPYPSAMANNWLTITPDGRFLYATNANAGEVRTFTIGQDGALAELTEQLVTIPAESIKTSAVRPSGDYLYVGLWTSGTVGAFRVDRATGALTAVEGSPFVAGTRPKSIAVEGQGRFVYVLNFGSNNLSAFQVDEATGALVLVDTYPTGTGPKMLITAP
jgi:6-phosphogluconolactonase